MPARDLYHDIFVEALRADGWTITHDPLYLAYGNRNLYVDIGAEKETLAAEKGDEKIAAEINRTYAKRSINTKGQRNKGTKIAKTT